MNRELDREIAEKIFSCKVKYSENGEVTCDCTATYPRPHNASGWDIKYYSSDISAAWEIITELSKKYFLIQTRTYNKQSEQSMCLILPKAGVDLWITATGNSIPEAICKAALKTIDKLEK